MACKLQFFFVSSPFQYLFFLVRQKPVALLVDLIQDLVDALLCDIGDPLKRLRTGYLVIELILRGSGLPLPVGIAQVMAPIEEIGHPDAPVIAAPHLLDKEEPDAGASQVTDIGTGITMGDAG